MRKVIFSLIAFLFFATSAYATVAYELVDSKGKNIDSRGYSSYSVSCDEEGYYLVPLTTIIPGTHKILGWSIWLISDTPDTRIALYDDENTDVARSLLISESEDSTTQIFPHWLPYPRIINYGLVIWSGGGVGVTIYYTE